MDTSSRAARSQFRISDLLFQLIGFVSEQEYVVKLSGLNKKAYQSSLKAVECMLGLQNSVGLRDLAVQYGCMEAVKAASQILRR